MYLAPGPCSYLLPPINTRDAYTALLLVFDTAVSFPISSAIESDVAADVLVGDGAVVDVGISDVSVRFIPSVGSAVSV